MSNSIRPGRIELVDSTVLHRRADGTFQSPESAANDKVRAQAERVLPQWSAFHVTKVSFNNNEIRALVIEGLAWFVLQDMQWAFREMWETIYAVPQRDRAVINVHQLERNKSALQQNGKVSDALLISEVGVAYQAVDKGSDEARNFADWVIREAGPSLRAADLIESTFAQLPVKRTKVAPYAHYQHDDKPTTVYRMLDEAGSLLYVGISMSSLQRLTQHRSTKSWWREIAHINFTHYPDRASAREAERAAIVSEQPRYNIAS